MGKIYFTTGEYLKNIDKCDLVINLKNNNINQDGSVNKIILDASGSTLEEYLKKKYDKKQELGEVRITPGFDLNTDIMHLLVPNDDKESNLIKVFINCYINVLEELKNNRYKNILFNSLGDYYKYYRDFDIAKPLMILFSNFCKNNDINIYFNNLTTEKTDIYLRWYLIVKGIDLKEELLKLDTVNQVRNYIEENIYQLNVKELYKEFVKKKEIEDMNLAEKIICLQYTVENYDVNKSDIDILIKSL